ncbi:MAG TPA: hypothetical protein VN363_05950 [Anaerolineales bacterium]|nr:hypothetical protein [Anaerolineales bacterium]
MITWLFQNRKSLQLGLLILLAASFLGPWTFEVDGVPPPEFCDSPYVRLTPERCVRLVPGYEMVFTGFRFVVELFMGGLTASLNLREALNGIVIILVILVPLLPLAAILWQVLHGDQELSRRGRAFFYASLVLGFIAALLPFVMNWPPRATLFWGLWAYLILNDSCLMLDILTQAGMRAQTAIR